MAYRVLAVVRVSTTEQASDAHYSFAAQRRAIQRYADDRGWLVVHTMEYVQSGGANEKELSQILSLVQDQRIDCVCVYELDRLARDMVSTMLFLEDLQKVGCRFASVLDDLDLTTPDGELKMMLLAMFAHYFRRQLSRKVKGGQSERFRSQKPHGKVPFGYRMQDDRFVVHPEEAEIVRQIFAWYLQDIGIRGIAKRLNEAQVPGYSGKIGHWQTRLIRMMLTRPAYCGDLVYQRFHTDRDRNGHRHTTMQQPTIISDVHPAIIDRATWDQVQRRIAQKRHLGPRSQKSRYPLSGLMRCGVCGRPMRINRTAYVCAGYIEHGTCSRMTAIPRKQAEAWLTAKLSDLLSATPDANTLHRWLHDQSEYREWMVKLHVRQSTIDRTVKRMENATNRLLDGTLTPGEFRDIQTRLRSALADAQQEPDVPIEFIEVWREQVQALQANIASPQDILFVRRALHQVIDHITVTTTRDLMIAWREPPPPYDPNIDLDAG